MPTFRQTKGAGDGRFWRLASDTSLVDCPGSVASVAQPAFAGLYEKQLACHGLLGKA